MEGPYTTSQDGIRWGHTLAGGALPLWRGGGPRPTRWHQHTAFHTELAVFAVLMVSWSSLHVKNM